jgi:hypothetical protein
VTDQNSEAGFTVFELLVALAIVGGVVAALVGIMDTARRLQTTVDLRHQRYAETAQLRGVLLDALSQLHAAPGAPSLSGDQRRMTLLAEAPRPLGMAEPVMLGLDPGEDRQGLIATWRAPTGEAPLAAPLWLIAPDRSVRFDYLDPEGHWTSKWDRPDQLPQLLRVTIADVDRRSDPTILQLGLRALAASHCARASDPTSCGARK